MKKINLECFADQQKICLNTSLLQNVQITNPLDRVVSLKITNLGSEHCELFLQLRNLVEQDLWQKLKLTVSDYDKIYFRALAADLLTKEQAIGFISPQQQTELFFDFDLMPLLSSNEKVQLKFDLILNFLCKEIKQSQLATQSATSSSVLAASNSSLVVADKIKQDVQTDLNWLIYFLSSLFVFCFFVIMKFLNGKKKKKIN